MDRERQTATEVRRNWRAQLDRAKAQIPVAFSRGGDEFAVISVSLLQSALRRGLPAPVAVAEDGGWTIVLDGHPIAADGADLDEALDEFIVSLNDYADAWIDRLHAAPNHQHAAPLVQLVATSSVAELREWVDGSVQSAVLA